MKARLLLTSALFMFAQIPASQAQATVDVSKITCEDYFMDKNHVLAVRRDVA
jgi:hypothetical protein